MPDRSNGREPRRVDRWASSDRRIARVLGRPLQRFLETEASGGIVVLAAAVAALVWANSPWSGSYESLWHVELRVPLGGLELTHDLRHWVNDALMAIFFFVVGLEIKRELVAGELRDPRAAALPAVAALGGMVVPAVVYAVVNAGGPGSAGWGIPMATDIAFAVGVLALAGRGVSSSLKLFLLALAIVDDIGAILVIALFYSGGIDWLALGVAAGLLALVWGMRRAGVWSIAVYVIAGVGVWLAVHESGVHATIAGVALGLLTPAETRRGEEHSPLSRLEHRLHPWSSYLIVPLFALANAGVSLADVGTPSRVTIGIALGLIVGKIVGISGASWLAVRAGVARLPEDVRWSQLVGVSAVAGIGFTVSLFIAGLAFGEGALLEDAKLGILGASTAAGVIGALLLARARRGTARPRP